MEPDLVCELGGSRKPVDSCSVVIFGASGDLTARKLVPALYQLHVGGLLPPDFRIIGFARREQNEGAWQAELRSALGRFLRSGPVDEAKWTEFARHLEYCRGDLEDPAAYTRLEACLAGPGIEAMRRNLLFYLAISPSQFAGVVERLHAAGMLHRGSGDAPGWQRIVVEKPFGHDLDSARELNRALTRFATEEQIFRIDHYLGKETVQNLLMFRFSNAVFERLWNRDAIDHVQITVSESQGVGQRGGYYEEAGALRDMVQNHLLQVLSLVAMEPPVSLQAEAIRDEKVKLLRSVRPLSGETAVRDVARGQYVAGSVQGEPRPAYRQEAKVRPLSDVETFVALKLSIDNWRWSGVPFYLRTGKNLPLSASEVRVQFRRTPHVLFAAQCGQKLDPNALTIRLQPNEGISLRFNGKVPGTTMTVSPVRMHFSYHAEFGAYTPEAYERLLLESMAGDPTLFIRRDEVEVAWQIVDGIREGWADKPLVAEEFYAAGTWGPAGADLLLNTAGHAWREPLVIQG